jgi:hypothetical protein
MAEHRWSVLCHRGCIDKYSNMLSILDVTDELIIQATRDPESENASVTLELQLVTMWARSEPDRPEISWSTVMLRLPDGNAVLVSPAADVNLESHSRLRLILRVQTIPFKGEGTYWFIIGAANSSDGPFEPVGRVPLDIKIKDASTSPEQLSVQAPDAPLESS